MPLSFNVASFFNLLSDFTVSSLNAAFTYFFYLYYMIIIIILLYILYFSLSSLK